MTPHPQVIDLVGSAAANVAIDSAGDNFDGAAQISWPFDTPNPYQKAKFVCSDDATQTDADITYILRDFNASSDVTSTSQVSVDSTQTFTTFDPDVLDGTADIGLRASVANPSGTTGATTDIDAKLILLP